MRAAWLLVGVAATLAVWGVLPVPSDGAPTGRAAALDKKIAGARAKIARKRGTERALSTDVAAYSRRIDRLQGDITGLQSRQSRIQADLDAKRSELIRLQEDLRRQRARLVRLRARLAEAREVLSGRLVALYKADEPDMISVVLSADGFAELVERGDFIQRVGDQDKRIVTLVRRARVDAISTAKRLDRLEARQEKVTLTVLARRNQVAQVKHALVGKRVGFSRTREGKARALTATRATRQNLEGDLKDMEAEQAKILATLQAAQQRNSGTFSPSVAGPPRQGSGNFSWPINGPIVSPFGQRWGRLHAGIDIAAPAGTPIHVVDSGRVVIAGPMGGYGNYTCVQHNATVSTCYAHQSSISVSNGANVSKGQVIGAVGCTGHCFGDHLHFEVRVNGSPVDPMGYL